MLEYFYFERLKYSSGVKWIIFYDLLLIFFFFETLICNRGQTYRAKNCSNESIELVDYG